MERKQKWTRENWKLKRGKGKKCRDRKGLLEKLEEMGKEMGRLKRELVEDSVNSTDTEADTEVDWVEVRKKGKKRQKNRHQAKGKGKEGKINKTRLKSSSDSEAAEDDNWKLRCENLEKQVEALRGKLEAGEATSKELENKIKAKVKN